MFIKKGDFWPPLINKYPRIQQMRPRAHSRLLNSYKNRIEGKMWSLSGLGTELLSGYVSGLCSGSGWVKDWATIRVRFKVTS